jgi:response regulator RpfG family c-di-GMP phosphodiesterase
MFLIKINKPEQSLKMHLKETVLIFILDDDEMTTQSIGILLQENGYLNYKLFNNPDALMKEISQEVRIFLIDYRLDGPLNGLDVIDKIKAIHSACYFILISGMKSYEVIERFCNMVNRGRTLSKDDPNFSGKLIKFLSEIIDDIRLMNIFYTGHEEMKKSLQHVKTLLKRNDTDK